MALELNDGEPLGPGLRRVVTEGIDLTLDALHGTLPPDPEAVHAARKTLKVVRAALRLVEPAFDRHAFAVEDHAFRDAARPLSVVRDAQVLVEVLAGLQKQFRDELAPAAFAAVAKQLARRAKSVARHNPEQPDPGSAIVADLERARARAADWPLDDVGWSVVGTGLEDQYAAGRKAMKRALAKIDDEDMHQWRKRVKDHRHHLELLTPLWPEVMPALASAAHTLGTLLGDDHDLAILAHLLHGELKEATPKPDRQALSALIARRRQTLQQQAARLGGSVYAERSHHFARRMHQYWEASA